MGDSSVNLTGTLDVLQGIWAEILAYLPKVLIAILVLVLGWLLARQIRVIVVHLIGRLDRVWQKFLSAHGRTHLQPRHPPAHVVGELVFWLLLLIFITLSTEILGLNIFGAWLKEIVSYLPLAAAGLLIVLVGFVVSSLARDLLASAASSAGLVHGDVLGRVTQIVILFTSIVIGVDQIGIDIEFITVVAGIFLGATLGAIALAFGLGARDHVRNIIAANQVKQNYRIGDRIRIDGIDGKISGFSISRVMIDTAGESVDIPASVFDEKTIFIIERGAQE